MIHAFITMLVTIYISALRVSVYYKTGKHKKKEIQITFIAADISICDPGFVIYFRNFKII